MLLSVAVSLFLAAQAAPAVATVRDRPRIEWVDCARFTQLGAGVSAKCGYLRVRELRQNPASRTIGVAFMVLHSPGNAADDAVVQLTGGPGNRGIPRKIARFSGDPDKRDRIFVEQRGTALADPPLQCPQYADALLRAQRGEIVGSELARAEIAAAKECVSHAVAHGARLAGYTTKAMVKDIEDLRAALGYRQLDLIGLSYSGKIVAEYARDYPEHTRLVVGNSPLPVEANYDESGQSAMRRTLDLIFASCAQSVACNGAHPNLDAKLREIVARAARQPWQLEVPDPDRRGATVSVRVTDWVLANALLNQLYSPDTFELIPALIDAIWSGDHSALASIVDVSRSSYPWLMRAALWCNEEVPFEDPRRIAADLAAYPEFGGVDQATIPLGLCRAAGLVVQPPAQENQPVKSTAPFLILSGLFDPAVPPDMSRRMAAELPNARLVIFPREGHGAGFNSCGAKLIATFIADPSAELDTRCVSDPPAPDFARHLP